MMKYKSLTWILILVLLSSTVLANPLDGLKEFSDRVGETVSITFQKIGKFIEGIQLVGLNIYFVLLVLGFFTLVSLTFIIPIKVYPMLEENRRLVKKFYSKNF